MTCEFILYLVINQSGMKDNRKMCLVINIRLVSFSLLYSGECKTWIEMTKHLREASQKDCTYIFIFSTLHDINHSLNIVSGAAYH